MTRIAAIRMLLAENPGFPEGALDRGYDVEAPLGADARLDPAFWAEDPSASAVRPFGPGAQGPPGRLVHDDGFWGFRLDEAEGADDAPLLRLELGAVRPGEYVWVIGPDGDALVYRIVSVS